MAQICFRGSPEALIHRDQGVGDLYFLRVLCLISSVMEDDQKSSCKDEQDPGE